MLSTIHKVESAFNTVRSEGPTEKKRGCLLSPQPSTGLDDGTVLSLSVSIIRSLGRRPQVPTPLLTSKTDQTRVGEGLHPVHHHHPTQDSWSILTGSNYIKYTGTHFGSMLEPQR